MSSSSRAISAAVLIIAANVAAAQNLIENPSFDTDATGWTTGPWTAWSPRQDHTPATLGLGGSLQIDTGLPDSGKQCLAVKPNTAYIFSTWFMQDPTSDFAPCSNPNWNVEISWWEGVDCTQTKTAPPLDIIPLGDIPKQWTQLSILHVSPPLTGRAQVKFTASCPALNGSTIMYFDDVSFQPDDVFLDDFELHAGETGPEQPRM
jgi:hypothetical protein